MKIKKLISCLAAVAMLTATVPMAFAEAATNAETVHQINASGETVFEVEDFFDVTTHRIEDNQNASGKKVWRESYAANLENNMVDMSTKINIPEDGYYRIDFVGSVKRNNISKITLLVDSVAAVDNTSAGTVTTITDGFYPNYGGDTYQYLHKFSAKIYLQTGEHTLKLQMPYGTGTSRAAGAVDTVSFTQDVHKINATGTTTFEVEELFDVNTAEGSSKRIIEDEKASGGKYWYEYYASTAVDKTVVFEVEDDSEYRLEMVANKIVGNLSYIMLYVDDVMQIKNWQTEGTETEIDGPINDTGNLRKYSAEIVLRKGKHTLNLQMPFGTGTSRAAGAVDTISFTDITKTLNIGSQKAVYEYENVWSTLYGSATIVKDENASGGYFLKNGTDKTGPTQKYAKVVAAEDGLYKVNFVMEENGNFLSYVALKIDDEIVIKNVLGEESAYTTTELIGAGSAKLKDYYAYAYLTKGTHDLIVDFYSYSKQNKDRHAYSFDSLTFEKVTPAALPENGGKIEAEGNFGGMLYNGVVTENDSASGGALIQRKGGSYDNETLTGFIDVKKAGFYNADLYAIKYESWLSAVTMKIDGNQIIKSSNNAKGETLSNVYPDDTYTVAKHKAASPVYLTEGEHKIEVTFAPRLGTDTKNVHYSFDCVEFTPYGEDLTFTSDLDQIAGSPFYIIEDEEPTTETIVVKLNGGKIENGSTYQITYKSSNEEVMTVSAYGEITPKKAGYSDVSVAVGIGGNTLETFSERVYVLDETYYRYIANAKYANGKLTFDAIDGYEDTGYEDTGFAATAYAAVYTGDSLTDVDIVALSENDTEYEANVTAKTGDTIMIFVWDANYAPVWFATEVK